MAEQRKISGMQKLGLAMAAFGQGMTGQPFASNVLNSWQQQDELAAQNEYRKWQMGQEEKELATRRQKIMMDDAYRRKALETGTGVFTIDPITGGMSPVGNVPKGSKVVSPMSMISPDQKIQLEAKSKIEQERQANLAKVKRLYPIIDIVEREWIKTKPGNRAEGLGKAVMSPLQVDKDVTSYQTFVKGMRAQLARAMGDVGNLSEPEQQAALNLVPTVSDSKDVGVEKLNKIRAFISNLEGGNIDQARGMLSQRFNYKGKVYNIPPDKIEAFKKAKGIK